MCWSLEQWRRCVGLRGCVCGGGGGGYVNYDGPSSMDYHMESLREQERIARDAQRDEEIYKQLVEGRQQQQQDTSDSSGIQLIVSGLSGGPVTVDLPQNGSVFDLKYEIFHKTGVNPSAQILKTCKVLDINLPLSVLNISNGSSIDLTSRCFGGGDFDELPKIPFQDITNNFAEENDSKMPALPSKMPTLPLLYSFIPSFVQKLNLMYLCLSLSSASTGTVSNDLKPASKPKKSKCSTGRVYKQPTKEDILLRKEQELKRSNLLRQQVESQERRRKSAERRQESLQHLDEHCGELESAVLDPNSDAGSLQHGLNKLMKECNVAQTFRQVDASSILSRCMAIQQHIKSTELEIPTAAVAASAKSSSVVTKKKALSQGKRKVPVKKAHAKNDFATLSDDSDYDEPPTKKKSSKKPSRKTGSSSQSQSKVNDRVKTRGRKRPSMIGNSKFVFISH